MTWPLFAMSISVLDLLSHALNDELKENRSKEHSVTEFFLWVLRYASVQKGTYCSEVAVQEGAFRRVPCHEKLADQGAIARFANGACAEALSNLLSFRFGHEAEASHGVIHCLPAKQLFNFVATRL